jgi:hypothetical protein
VINSSTKPECPVCQIGLFGFSSSNSAASFVKFQNFLFTPSPLGDIKGLSNTYKDLSEEDWTRFVEKYESENFATNSEYMQWLRSKNKLDHHIGDTSYARKQRKWQQKDERLAQQGLENLYDNFCGWLGPFMLAHSKLTELGDVIFYSQSTTVVAQRVLRESSKDSNSERENDALSKALQTKEQ